MQNLEVSWRRLFFETPFDFSPDAVSKLGRAALRHALIVGELNQRPVVGAAQKAKRPIQRSNLALTQKGPFGVGGIDLDDAVRIALTGLIQSAA